MSNHAASLPLLGAMILAGLGVSSARAADWPLGPTRDRPLVLQDRTEADGERYIDPSSRPRPHGRPVNGGPGYVGSDYGLGKPAYTGLGSRPDWGYSE
jgi:hypothetical protein